MKAHASHRSAQVIHIEAKWSGVALAIACIALGLAGWSMLSYSKDYRELERENRLLQLKVDDMRVALNAQGIATNKHATGDSP